VPQGNPSPVIELLQLVREAGALLERQEQGKEQEQVVVEPLSIHGNKSRVHHHISHSHEAAVR